MSGMGTRASSDASLDNSASTVVDGSSRVPCQWAQRNSWVGRHLPLPAATSRYCRYCRYEPLRAVTSRYEPLPAAGRNGTCSRPRP